MGAAASISIEMAQFDKSVMPKNGVTLSYFEDFITECGGREVLKGMTTTDVCTKFITKWTEKRKCSFNDLLREIKHPAYHDQSEVFISHAWKYEFLKLVDILQHHFVDRPNVVVWFDLFSNNQHQATTLNYDWWATTFRTAIKDFGYTVMVLMPWEDPIPLQRSWCLFELYCTYDTKCRFEVAMGEQGFQDFIRELDSSKATSGDVVNKMLAKIDLKRSEAFKLEDTQMIHATVERDVLGGLMQLNAVVLSLMRNWVLNVLGKEMKTRVEKLGGSHPDTLSTIYNLAGLYRSQGQYDKAEPLYLECHHKQKTVLGDSHPSTLNTINNLAVLYDSQGEYDKAGPLYEECLQKQKSILGDSHPSTLNTINNLAVLYDTQGRFDNAEPLYEECLQKQKAVLGDSHPSTLNTINNLAVLYNNQGQYDKAEPLFLECLKTRKAVLGDSHPETLSSIDNLAGLYYSEGQNDKAEPLYLECLQKYKAVLGDSHPDTLNTTNNLAVLYNSQNQYDKAESLYLECLQKQKAVLGDSHPSTLNTINNLAVLYDSQDLYDKAEPFYLECLQKQKAVLGDSHLDTLTTLNRLVSMRKKQGK